MRKIVSISAVIFMVAVALVGASNPALAVDEKAELQATLNDLQTQINQAVGRLNQMDDKKGAEELRGTLTTLQDQLNRVQERVNQLEATEKVAPGVYTPPPPPAAGTTDRRGFTVQLEPMYMDVKGNDVHFGDVLRATQVTSVPPAWPAVPATAGIRWGVDPISVNMDEGFTLRGELAYRWNEWGVGASGWWFDSGGSVSGAVSSPASIISPTGNTLNWNTVDMWNNRVNNFNFLWGTSPDELYGFPVTYQASNDLSVWTMDLYAIRTLAELETSYIDLLFGLKMGGMDNQRAEAVQTRELINWIPELDTLISLRDCEHLFSSTGEADYGWLVGPMVGFQGKGKWRFIGVEGMVSQSALIGQLERSATFMHISDQYTVIPVPPLVREFQVVHREAFSEFEQDDTVVIPVTEAKLKLMFDLYQGGVIKNVALGLGGFTSVWWNAPTAPSWTMEQSELDPLTRTISIELDESTLIYYGGMAGVQVEF